jgi:hypothetical protein
MDAAEQGIFVVKELLIAALPELIHVVMTIQFLKRKIAGQERHQTVVLVGVAILISFAKEKEVKENVEKNQHQRTIIFPILHF